MTVIDEALTVPRAANGRAPDVFREGAWIPMREYPEHEPVDFAIVGTRVLVEFDGRSKYGAVGDLWAEKQREDRIRALGYEVVRLTWADLRDPDRVARLVAAAISRSGRDPTGHTAPGGDTAHQVAVPVIGG